MSITVRAALGLPEMQGVSVAAGSAGLGREISSVNVMEVPDISRFLKPDMLLITTMYPIRDNEEIQRKLIPLLVEKGVAALALAPLHEHAGIPEFMIKQADDAGFSLLKLPYDIPFDNIMNSIFHKIIEKRYRSGLIENILQRKIDSLTRVIAAGKSYGWNLEGSFIPVVVHGDIPASLPPDVIVIDLNSNILLLFPLVDLSEAKSCRAEIKSLLEAYHAKPVGIGRAIETIMELPKGYAQAEQAININLQTKGEQSVSSYDDLGVYRVLSSSTDVIEKQLFINEFLGPILKESELIITLRVYFDNHGNQRNTAKAMRVHYNTISYRMARIEHLTGLNLDNSDDSLCLHIALKLLDIINL